MLVSKFKVLALFSATSPSLETLHESFPNSTYKLKKQYFYFLIIILIILIPVFYFGIINTMVSLKYETDCPTECISKITGDNLCDSISNLKTLIYSDITLIILLIIFRKKITKNGI